MRSFEDLRWVTRGALDESVRLEFQNTPTVPHPEVVMDLSVLDVRDADAQLFTENWRDGPMDAPSIGEVMPGAAENVRGCATATWCAGLAPVWWTGCSCAS